MERIHGSSVPSKATFRLREVQSCNHISKVNSFRKVGTRSVEKVRRSGRKVGIFGHINRSRHS